MIRCPYIHEMHERLLGPTPRRPLPISFPPLAKPEVMDRESDCLLDSRPESRQIVGTVVKLNPDGFGAHTTSTHHHHHHHAQQQQPHHRTPLVPCNGTDDDDERTGGHHPMRDGAGTITSTISDSDDDGIHLRTHLRKIIEGRKPKNAKTSLFIVTSLVYAMLLIVVCVAYVISDVTTHRLPVIYYEGFFTYLYGASILFLLYVFCFLLQESSCCNGKPKPPKEKKPKKEKKSKKNADVEAGKEGKDGKEPAAAKDGAGKSAKEESKGKGSSTKASSYQYSKKQEVYPKKKRDQLRESQRRRESATASPVVAAVTPAVTTPSVTPGTPASPCGSMSSTPAKRRDIRPEQVRCRAEPCWVQEPSPNPEAAMSPRFKRKTTQDPAHGSFFLRVGAIAFGLGTMIYTGLEFGSFFEIPFTSPCHQILRGVNPLLQMIFTFMQMYFIFMNARLNIHRFKVLARFGLMHIVATNICVWIRTLVLESLKEITAYHQRRGPEPEDSVILENIRQHTLRNAGMVMGTDLGPSGDTEWEPISVNLNAQEDLLSQDASSVLSKIVQGTAHTITEAATTLVTAATSTSTAAPTTTTMSSTSTSTTTASTSTTTSTTSTTPAWIEPNNGLATSTSTTARGLLERLRDVVATETTTTYETPSDQFGSGHTLSTANAANATSATPSAGSSFLDSFMDHVNYLQRNSSLDQTYESLDSLFPSAFIATSTAVSSNATAVSCGRVNIMGTIVQDSAPYLYPFIIEYSLIGAAVIYVMWKHIGRYPKFTNEEDLEHRLEVMLSRRAVVMAQQARTGRVDCVGASKGLFFGLLLLVGSLICLILFFVLVRHPQLSLLAIYLADVSHCALMVLAIFAIIIGFIRVQNLKFRCEEQSNLNDILLRISAFGLFVYSTFSVIAGSLNAFESEPNLLVMVTGIVAVVQVVIQLLFIADVSRRRVHLPEHDRIKPGRQIVTFLLICNISMFAIYTFEAQKVFANPVQLDFYGFIAWSLIQRVTLPLCIFHRFHSAVTLAEVWKTTYKARLE
ncbi:proton channel OtopLc-like [Anopheles marshallii]|uniref:proton channel OtopLc-like n=1 Tax=Anopheles marshallii TaxID=1521116 RepID=UPI00237AEFBB|nr:proton channel OtopLc-like [Anopheles marshallii]